MTETRVSPESSATGDSPTGSPTLPLKIHAERAALAEVRAKAASAAAAAAAALIAQKHDAGSDKALIDRTIAGISAQRMN